MLLRILAESCAAAKVFACLCPKMQLPFHGSRKAKNAKSCKQTGNNPLSFLELLCVFLCFLAVAETLKQLLLVRPKRQLLSLHYSLLQKQKNAKGSQGQGLRQKLTPKTIPPFAGKRRELPLHPYGEHQCIVSSSV